MAWRAAAVVGARRMSVSASASGGVGLRPSKILCIAGSCREGSFNKKLLDCAGEMAAGLQSADVTIIDMREFPLPLFCEDISNAQISESARELKQLFLETDGFIFACPEYNGTMTPLLNNLCAWMSRPFSKDEPLYAAFKGKFAMLTSTSPGALGGLRGLNPMSQMLSFVGVHVLANQVGIGGSYSAFDEKGGLVSEKNQRLLRDATTQLVTLCTDRANREVCDELEKDLHAQYGHIELHHHHPVTVDDFMSLDIHRQAK